MLFLAVDVNYSTFTEHLKVQIPSTSFQLRNLWVVHNGFFTEIEKLTQLSKINFKYRVYSLFETLVTSIAQTLMQGFIPY